MKLSVYSKYLTLDQRMDMLNHYPCFAKAERLNPDVRDFHQETLQRWIDSGNDPILHDIWVDEFEGELGFAEFCRHIHTTEGLTVWKTYCQIKDNIINLDKNHKSLNNVLLSIINAPSTSLNDVSIIHNTLTSFARRAKDTNDDYFKETMGTVFGMLLPYKLHAYGMVNIVSSDVAPSDPNMFQASFNYFEILIRLFMNTLQGMRGTSLSDTKHMMTSLTVYIYLYMTYLYPNRDYEVKDMDMFSLYIDKMLQAGIGAHIAQKVMDMTKSNTDFLEIISHLDNTDNKILSHMIDSDGRARKELEKDVTVGNHTSDKSIDWVWSNTWIISGDGYFSRNPLGDKYVEDMALDIIATNKEQISRHFSVNPKDVKFDIDEYQYYYIKKNITQSVASAVRYPCSDMRTDVRLLIYLDDLEEVFMLFTIPESKDVFGLSVNDKKEKTIIKLGINDSVKYRLIAGDIIPKQKS